MIRKAVWEDVDQIENAYDEHFAHEARHTAYTMFRRGVYPTRADAERAVAAGTMFVCEEGGVLGGSIIIDQVQPKEYAGIPWQRDLSGDDVMVIHLLMVRPSMAGRGIATELLRYAAERAENCRCRALRLDTGGQNFPAVSLYQKNGFTIAARAPKAVGGAVHQNHLYLERALQPADFEMH